MASHSSTLAGTIWESPRLTRPDGEHVVRVVRKGSPLTAPDPQVAASGGVLGLVAVAVSSVLRTVGRVAGRPTFQVCLVRRVPADSRSYDETVVSVDDVRGEQEALAFARELADDPA